MFAAAERKHDLTLCSQGRGAQDQGTAVSVVLLCRSMEMVLVASWCDVGMPVLAPLSLSLRGPTRTLHRVRKVDE